jgi:hypothetical protein
LPDERILGLIERHFDLRPSAIIEALDLRRPIYRQTAAYGHFGRPDLDLPWERTDRADALAADAGSRCPSRSRSPAERPPATGLARACRSGSSKRLMYAVIMAGGGGTDCGRSARPSCPSRSCGLLGEQSLLQRTVARLFEDHALGLAPADVTVVTEQRYAPLVASSCPASRCWPSREAATPQRRWRWPRGPSKGRTTR